MAFIETSTQVFSFADYSDVSARDQRLFVENEGLTQTVVEDLLVRSTERILSQIRATTWWRTYFIKKDTSNTQISTVADIPALDATNILSRKADFTDLCVYHTLYEFLLPKVADFSDEGNAERQKISYYQQKYTDLLNELITAGDWYDFDGDNTLESSDYDPGVVNPRRIR